MEATQVFSHRDKHGDILLLSCQIVSYSAKPWTAALQASLSLMISQSLPKFMSIASDMGHISHVWCHPAISSSDILFSFCPQSSQHQGLSQLQWYIHGVKYSTSKGKKFWCVPTWMNFANTMLSVKSQTEEDRCLPTRIVVSYDSVYLKNCQTILQSCYIILCFLQKWTHIFFLIFALFWINCIKMFSFHFVSTLSLLIML